MSIESALAQTHPNVEIIVVDDGSTDGTAAAMAQYAGRVTYIQQANQGVAAARNTGFRASAGEYVTFLDDDDLALPDKIARQVQALGSHPRAGLVHCGYYFADQDGNYLSKVELLPEGDVLRELVCSNFVWVGAPLIRRRCLEQVGLFDQTIPGITADWEMWLRVALAGYPFACVQETLGVYRIQPDSMMADVSKLERGMFAVLDRVFSRPVLPAGVAALKAQAYGEIHFWVSCRYYAAGRWDDARRNLAKALAECPQLSEGLAQRFCDDALSPRVSDPLQFITGVLDHLPAVAQDLGRCRLQLLARVHTGLALRSYGMGDVAGGRRQFAQALALDPARAQSTQDFARSLSRYAMHLPVGSPLQYVDTVLGNLPDQAQPLARVRPQVVSEVNIGCAFQDFAAGRRSLTVRRVLTALRHRPAWLKNRGVVSIFFKSLLGLMPEAQRLS